MRLDVASGAGTPPPYPILPLPMLSPRPASNTAGLDPTCPLPAQGEGCSSASWEGSWGPSTRQAGSGARPPCVDLKLLCLPGATPWPAGWELTLMALVIFLTSSVLRPMT